MEGGLGTRHGSPSLPSPLVTTQSCDHAAKPGRLGKAVQQPSSMDAQGLRENGSGERPAILLGDVRTLQSHRQVG